ncbi:Uridine phosphorylase [Mycena indigotica]|uniref:Uridine phosphorylase n=1 Tax=Mycena indigotica TaxID=2126181 RepID=A0A8H6SQK1_9AGAR|nr:Uridine phosphorylase [Mycena indigotica]KAF7303604.1 Uridine phosphorylase [Mycena indigotica]
MKETLTDANFPRTADLRVYHLGLRPGEVANRIVTVGSPSRARTVAGHFDASPKPFELASERGFLTITGRYQGTPISVVSIGMGHPNVDFFVREVRESLSGDMLIIRLGSCGGLIDVPVGSVVVPKQSIAVERNLDFNFFEPEGSAEEPYRFSKPAMADEELYNQVYKSLLAAKPAPTDSDKTVVVNECSNASADSFYSSQGRQTSFPDQNENLIERLQATVPDLATFEMETFWIFHLAACWSARARKQNQTTSPRVPLATSPVSVDLTKTGSIQSVSSPLAGRDTVIRAASAQMIFAARNSRDFITPEQVLVLEEWTAKGVLDALVAMNIPQNREHPAENSVWVL